MFAIAIPVIYQIYTNINTLQTRGAGLTCLSHFVRSPPFYQTSRWWMPRRKAVADARWMIPTLWKLRFRNLINRKQTVLYVVSFWHPTYSAG